MSPKSPSPINPSDYAHSAVHYAVATQDHITLSRLLSSLPSPIVDPTLILTETDSLAADLISDQISSVLDSRSNIPNRETPLHLAVRLADLRAVKLLVRHGADVSLQNSEGWSPLQDAIVRKLRDIAIVLLKHHNEAAYLKWRRRVPRLVAVLRRMRDFYMEIGFHFESSVVPFIDKIAPSDTYKIWKKDGNLRADMTLAGFEGLKIQRSDQSFLFLGDGDRAHGVTEGSLIVLRHEERKVFDAFENGGTPMTDAEIAAYCSQSSVYRPGMDVTKAELVAVKNWRRQERIENVGEWKSKVYEINNVSFSFRSRKACGGGGSETDLAGSEQVLPLELDEESEDGFLVAEIGDERKRGSEANRRHSSFSRREREFVTVSRKSVDINLVTSSDRKRIIAAKAAAAAAAPEVKEKEIVRSLRPAVWLTEQFPLKIEELLPLLDILANKVKAVRRLRELLTTKFPPGTLPVKISIPVVPTVKVVITFTKFVELPPTDLFYTPLSSPRHLNNKNGDTSESNYKSCSSSSSSSNMSSWLWRSSSRRIAEKQQKQQHSEGSSKSDPFEIPRGYTWSSIDDKTNQKLKKSKSVRKPK